MDAAEIGRRLAERHAAEAPTGDDEAIEPSRSLLNYAEMPHTGDWTLRSALVRLAQRDPARVGTLLQVMRRIDGPLHHVTRTLQDNPAICDEALASNDWDPDELIGERPLVPYPDIRTADLARVVAAGFDSAAITAGYDSVAPLEREEALAIPLLAEAARFDLLARRLAVWADGDRSDPPLDALDRLSAEGAQRLDALGVPEETGPPTRGGRSRG